MTATAHAPFSLVTTQFIKPIRVPGLPVRRDRAGLLPFNIDGGDVCKMPGEPSGITSPPL
jgi:hypothetical protein